MPNIDLGKVQERTGAIAYDVEPGGYVAVITDYDEQADRMFVKFSLDIAEGPHKGIYARSQYPLSDVVSWKSEAAQGMAKHKLHVLADSNPGFDSATAFLTDDWKQFVNKVVGIVVRERLFTKSNGEDGHGVEVAEMVTPDAIRAGDFVVPGPRDARTNKGGAAPNPPSAPAAAQAEPMKMPWE